MTTVRVYVPGSIGNVGPGLDILGLAVRGAGDTVFAERLTTRRIELRNPGHPDLPTDPERHATALAALAALRMAGRRGRIGLALSLKKGLPLSGGQGGSAASAVAGAVAANALMGNPLGTEELLAAALEAEATVAGRHLDNIAPSLVGGLVLIRSLDPIDICRLPVPGGMRIVLAKPGYEMATKRGRTALPKSLPRATALHQAAQVAAMVAGACQNDLALFGRAIDDRIAEPARAPLLPGFVEAKAAAIRAGAVGCSISGSGPTLFAIAADDATAERVGRAVTRAYRRAGFDTSLRVTAPDRRGARILR
ncbi:MAG: homoserine kinase [Gemmatimonadales bacterium]